MDYWISHILLPLLAGILVGFTPGLISIVDYLMWKRKRRKELEREREMWIMKRDLQQKEIDRILNQYIKTGF